MDRRQNGVRWDRVVPGGMAALLLTQLALAALASIAPGLAADRQVWLVAGWATVWVGVCAALVALTVPARDAPRHGLLVGLAAALIALTFYGWAGLAAAGFCAATLLAGLFGGTMARRERVAG